MDPTLAEIKTEPTLKDKLRQLRLLGYFFAYSRYGEAIGVSNKLIPILENDIIDKDVDEVALERKCDKILDELDKKKRSIFTLL